MIIVYSIYFDQLIVLDSSDDRLTEMAIAFTLYENWIYLGEL